MKLGIDMGGMSIKMGLVNEENEIIGRITIPTDLTVPYQMLVERMADAVQQMLENAGMTLEQCEGIGIGSPGTIDAKRGVILYSNNFGWENVPIVEELKKHLDVGIEIANDADAAALGEVYAGAAEGAENAVLLTLGTGVGSGVILDKKIFRGGMPGGCELGHLSIHHDGVRCTCVPLCLAHLLIRRQNGYASDISVQIPRNTDPDVGIQPQGLILCQHTYCINSGIDTIA